MTDLVEQLLVLARADATGDAVHARIELGALTEEVAADVGAAHPSHPIQVSTMVGTVVSGDAAQLRRAVMNLIANAAVHTAPGTPIEVDVGVEGAVVIVRVLDRGPGLPPGDPAQLFERFVRGEASRTRESGGTGLGLAITAAVAARHGGTVTAAMRDGGGSVFTLRLPAV